MTPDEKQIKRILYTVALSAVAGGACLGGLADMLTDRVAWMPSGHGLVALVALAASWWMQRRARR